MRIAKALALPLGIVALWSLVSVSGLANEFLMPPPWRVLDTALALARDGILWPNVSTSLGRVFTGFIITTILAFPLAVLVGLNRTARQLLDTPLEFARHVPPLAVTPLLILWFGIGELSKLAVIILATFFPIFMNTASGVSNADRNLVAVGRTMGLNQFEMIWRVILPASLPSIMVGLRLGLGFSWRALIGAELLAAASGLGYMIIEAEEFARTDVVMVGIFAIGVLGHVMDLVFHGLSKAAFPWIREVDHVGL